MNNKPLILISNDDGYQAKGINELIACLREMGDIVVFAPDGPRSGMSASITSEYPLKYSLVSQEEGVIIYKCNGTPVDCVKLALNEVLDRMPDLVVAGINHGGNMAIAVLYSGTMGAVAEGCVFGIPSIGVSLLDHEPDADFTESCRFARLVVRRVLKEGLPKGTYLNLNIPKGDNIKGMKVCRQAAGKWEKEYIRSTNGSGKPVFWMSGDFVSAEPIHPDNDMLALENGYASLVACKLDVTDYEWMKQSKEWEV